MLLTLSTTMPDATDLGFLLHKHPDKAQAFEMSGGVATVVWPEATTQRCTVALMLEVDPVALVRSKGNRGSDGFALSQYVNDKPYAASSMLAVALGKVFRTAMTGRCNARPELPGQAVPLEVHIPALPSRGGVDLVARLFAPLGWAVTATPIPLDPQIPEWGDSTFVDLHLAGTARVADALTQLYVLMPVLDDRKHYWISSDEVEKLMRAGGEWLGEHPERELITRRYLGHHRVLVAGAVARLAEVDDVDPEALDNAVSDDPEKGPTPLAVQRKDAVTATLRAEGASTVVDLGCGEGALLHDLVADPAFTRVLGAEVSHRALEVAARRLNLDRTPDTVRARLELIQSSAVYRDDRLAGFDAVVLMEVIEHIDAARLPALERAVFGHARPGSVLVTTPNAEYNVRYEFLPAGQFRHRDHRFEWTRAQFAAWAQTTATAYGYDVRFVGVGDVDPEVGAPTQMAVFRRVSA
ncbi:3' terminal RNA ribose 2'-O-methyltransferase Hen1 [Jatrophihabitans sp. GAS493]|uniref:3' terminal RNA ribose 2'-O-methyltransferase Hen1 n=1 Tax=Jatrophihabitans sp. GAS493 TaxID=1907575 RepID=UPI000BB88F89|nr:3' terminal RNA ribose 2'-O-methyltransferase Hen1 [Jatrophihabitans sp. GAS493]SOD73123.1 3' terminal RNA ribose 2'-O-methyltransferase Hen1 [Jatrophihabitans sp. GAS493]